MKKKSLVECFADLPDPRAEWNRCHKLIDIITIAFCAVLCGAEHWTEVERFGKIRAHWLRTFLELPGGIPSHDTFGEVFGRLDPDAFCDCFLAWIRTLYTATGGQAVAIDGKTLRGSYDRSDSKAALHMVHAWATENHLLLGQKACAEKSNEITAIPELLKTLNLKGCLVTIDALGCQQKIARQITGKKGDYLLGLKGNQKKLRDEVETFFFCAQRDNFAALDMDYQRTVEKGPGRIETRECWIVAEPSFEVGDEWGGLKSVGMVKSERRIDGVSTFETRYYICSSAKLSASGFAQAVRGHWGIENSLHWVLDVAFREDDCRVRKANGPRNFGVLRRFALSLLKQEKTICKLGVKSKRKVCGWDENYLLTILLGKDTR